MQFACGGLTLFICLTLIFMLLCSLHDPQWTPLLALGSAWIIFVFGGYGVGCIAQALDRPWGERMLSITTAVTVLGIAAIFVNGIIVSVLHIREQSLSQGLQTVFFNLWIGIGILIYLTGRRRRDELAGSPAIILAWPFMVFLTGGLVMGGLILAVPALVISAVFILGHKLGHPYLAVTAAAALPAAAAALRLFKQRGQ